MQSCGLLWSLKGLSQAELQRGQKQAGSRYENPELALGKNSYKQFSVIHYMNEKQMNFLAEQKNESKYIKTRDDS